MKASSILKHIWIGCFICGLFLAATGVAYAGATNTDNNSKTDVCTQQEKAVRQHEQLTTQVAVITVPDKENEKYTTAPKQAEVKKEEAGSGMFSFSFIYYLFYKTNFAESTNNAFKSSLKAFISRIID